MWSHTHTNTYSYGIYMWEWINNYFDGVEKLQVHFIHMIHVLIKCDVDDTTALFGIFNESTSHFAVKKKRMQSKSMMCLCVCVYN